MYPAPLVLDSTVGLEGDTRAGGLRDNSHKLEDGGDGSGCLGAALLTAQLWVPREKVNRSLGLQAHPSPYLAAGRAVLEAALTFSPLMKRCFSLRFTWSMDRPCSALDSNTTVPSGLETTRPFLPVICG